MPGCLDPSLATKLAKICGRLGSDYEGERAAAALLVSRTLRNAGLTWDEVFRPAPPVPEPAYTVPRPAHATQVDWALRFSGRLSEWERQFLRDISRRWRLTPKQSESLNRILFKLQTGGAA